MVCSTAFSLIRKSVAGDAWNDKIGEIRRARYREGRSIKRISLGLGVSRAAARKVLRSGATEFVCKRRTQPRPKIGPWQSELDGMLSENASRPKHERMTLMRIFEELRSLGCGGGTSAVRLHASCWRRGSGCRVAGEGA